MIMILLLAFTFVFADNSVVVDDTNVNISDDDGNVAVNMESGVVIINDENQEDETEDENMLKSNVGAQIRLEQLKKAIYNKIEDANVVLDNLNENDTQVDTETIQSYIEQYEELLQKIEAVNFEEDNEILAEQFVALKDEAISITKEFRETIRPYLTQERKDEIKKELKAKQEERKNNRDQKREEIKNKIEELKRKHISQQFSKFGAKNVLTDEEIQKFENGEYTFDQLKQKVQEKLSNMTEEEKKELRDTVKNNRKEAIQNNKEKIKELRDNAEKNKQKIMGKLRERYNAMPEEKRKEIESRFKNIEKSGKIKIENSKDVLEELKSNLREKAVSQNMTKEEIMEAVYDELEKNPLSPEEQQKMLEEIQDMALVSEDEIKGLSPSNNK